jgi:hypothetical protein
MPYNLRSNKPNKLDRFFDTYQEYIEKQNKTINITIKTLSGKNYNLTVNNNMSYENFFELVSKKTNISHFTFYLISNHRMLPKYEDIKDWMGLKDFNFNTDITLHLVLRLGFALNLFEYNKEDWF